MFSKIEALFKAKNTPYILVLSAIVFSILGMYQQGIEGERMAALILLHTCFAKLLSHTLPHAMSEWEKGYTWKMVASVGLGIAFFAFDAYLVHYGIMYVFSSWNELTVALASIAFALINVFAHWGYTPSPGVKTKSLREINDLM